MKRRSFIKALTAGAATGFAMVNEERPASERLQQFQADLSSSTNDSEFWSQVRSQFDVPKDLIHLNCGSIGISPKIVTSALIEYTREIEKDPYRNYFVNGLCERLESVRALAANFLNATTAEIVITRNTTDGMNLVARGLKLDPDDEVLTTNHEHPGGVACWQHLARQKGVKIIFVKMPPRVAGADEIIELVGKHITTKTKVFSFSHVDSITGLTMPIEKLSQLSKQQGIFFVCDGAQVPGMLQVDVGQLGVDCYASSSHKWLLAPKPSGLLYIRKSVQQQVQSMELSAGYQVYSAASGTRDIGNILAQGIAIEFLNVIGKQNIEQRVRALNQYLSDQLAQFKGLKRLTPVNEELSSGIVTFAIDRDVASSFEIANRLMNDHRIYVKAATETYSMILDAAGMSENYNALRFSTHIFNSEHEIDRTVEALATLLNQHH